jgi:hypothetical protein
MSDERIDVEVTDKVNAERFEKKLRDIADERRSGRYGGSTLEGGTCLDQRYAGGAPEGRDGRHNQFAEQRTRRAKGAEERDGRKRRRRSTRKPAAQDRLSKMIDRSIAKYHASAQGRPGRPMTRRP